MTKDSYIHLRSTEEEKVEVKRRADAVKLTVTDFLLSKAKVRKVPRLKR